MTVERKGPQKREQVLNRRRRSGTFASVTHRPLCCLLVLGLVGSPRGAAGHESMPVATEAITAPTAPGPAHYQRGEFAEAARVFEAEGTNKGLYNAGMARFAASKHQALAVDRWRRYFEATPPSAQERAYLEEKISEARKSLVSVRFLAEEQPMSRRLVLAREGKAEDAWTVTWPAGQGSVEVELDAVAWYASLVGGPEAATSSTLTVRAGEANIVSLVPEAEEEVAPVILRLGPGWALRRGVTLNWIGPAAAPPEREVHAAEAHYALTPGRWTVRAVAHGGSAEGTLELAGGPAELPLMLRRDRVERARLGLGLGLGAVAATLVVAGAVLTAKGAAETRACSGSCSLLNPQLHTTDGVAILAAGIAAVVPTVTAARGPNRRALAIEAGVGGALLAAGIPWYVRDGFRFHDGKFAEKDLAPGRAAAGILGAGIGLFTGAVIGLITYCTVQRRQGDSRACRRKSTAEKLGQK